MKKATLLTLLVVSFALKGFAAGGGASPATTEDQAKFEKSASDDKGGPASEIVKEAKKEKAEHDEKEKKGKDKKEHKGKHSKKEHGKEGKEKENEKENGEKESHDGAGDASKDASKKGK